MQQCGHKAQGQLSRVNTVCIDARTLHHHPPGQPWRQQQAAKRRVPAEPAGVVCPAPMRTQ